MSKRITTVAFALLSAITWIGAANGALINVQFGSSTAYTGAAVIGAGGDFWNNIGSNGGPFALNDSTNTLVSGVTLTTSSDGIGDVGDANPGAPFNTPNPYANLFRAYTADAPGGVSGITLTLNGLAAGTYDLYIYSATNLAGGFQNRAVSVSATTSIGTVGPQTIGPNSGATTLSLGANYQHLQPVVGVTGVLTINGALSNLEGDINGFQLVPVPEPSGLALISIAAVGFVAKLRRRRS
jgi:hypothetical protein